MSSIILDNNNIIREISVSFDTGLGITYNEFLDDPRYEAVLNTLSHSSRGEIFPKIMVPILHAEKSGVIQVSTVDRIEELFQYDKVEWYENGGSMYEVMNHGEKLDSEWWFFDSEVDSRITQMRDAMMIVRGDDRETLLEGKDLEDSLVRLWWERARPKKFFRNIPLGGTMRYRRAHITNHRSEYLWLNLLLIKEPLFLISSGNNLVHFVVTTGKNIAKHLHDWLGIIYQLTELQSRLFPTEDVGLIKEIRTKYCRKEMVWDRVFADIKEAIEKTGTIKLEIEVKNWSPQYLTGDFTENDLSRYNELKEHTSDYGFVAPKHHAGTKKVLVGQKNYRYKDYHADTDSL